MKVIKSFSELARYVSNLSGRASTFILVLGVILVWIVTGPIFAFSDSWQLVINTGTTIVTFVMVFLIQCVQRRLVCSTGGSPVRVRVRSPVA